MRTSTHPRIRVQTRGIITLAIGVLALGSAHSALKASHGDAPAPGEPIVIEGYDSWYETVPESENAAFSYLEAFEYFGDFTRVLGLSPTRSTPEVLAKAEPVIRQYLEDNAEALRHLHAAVGKPRCRFPGDLTTDGLIVDIDTQKGLRESIRHLSMEAEFRVAVEDDVQGATDSLLAALAASQAMREVPQFMSTLHQAACFNIVAATAEGVFGLGALNQEQLSRLAQALDAADHPGRLTPAFLGERSYGLATFDVYLEPKGLELSKTQYDETMKQLIEAAGLPSPEALDMAQAVREGVKALAPDAVAEDGALSTPFRIFETDAAIAGKLRAFRTAVAIEAFKLAEGRPPQMLTELAPTYLEKPPTDPFNGEPLHYRAEDDGYAVWSVGRNGRDDGGEQDKPEKDDEVFRVVKPGTAPATGR